MPVPHMPHPRHRPPSQMHQEVTTGQRLAENMAQLIGSWPFLIVQSCILFAWVVLNVIAIVKQWDPYPFILLNLALSFQAAYAGPVLLMASNRASEIDRSHAENAYMHVDEVNAKQDEQLDLLRQQLGLVQEQLTILRRQFGEMVDAAANASGSGGTA